jgi:hypothetical protein
MRTRTILTILSLTALVLLPALALAGANETPGSNKKPHRFGCFQANLWEFGLRDYNYFKKYVCDLQHYARGARYRDSTSDASEGGAGLWNYFTFCTDRRHDVMLVTTHGADGPRTTISQFAWTVQGLAARDSIFNYYDSIFPGCLVKKNYAHDSLTIEVNQTFYTNYFMTDQAFCWWATCYSSQLSMTNPVEARAFLGYDAAVESGKCYCDQKRVLERMNGWEGQAMRPLSQALNNINGICAPGGARLVAAGSLNTVLSPSVLEWQPQNIVCTVTPGWVKFDTSMDTDIPPAVVVKAYGDGYLTNHAWSGDDRIDFLVIPTAPEPAILYDVKERSARGKANHARLDGNTNPGNKPNAWGPNRDNFIWITTCPAPPVDYPQPLYPVPDPVTPTRPGTFTLVLTPVINTTGAAKTVTGTLTDLGGWFNGPPQMQVIEDGEAYVFAWEVDVPAGTLPGTANPITITATVPDGVPQTADGLIVVDAPLLATLVGPRVLEPGPGPDVWQKLVIRLENARPDTTTLTNPNVPDELGWPTEHDLDDPFRLPPFSAQNETLRIKAPQSVPPGTTNSLRLEGILDGEFTTIPVGSFSIGLPLVVEAFECEGCVPGRLDATLRAMVTNRSETNSFTVNVTAFESHGFSVIPNSPLVLPPQDQGLLEIVIDIPPDPMLVGEAGLVTVMLEDPVAGLLFETALNYVIKPAVAVAGLEPPPVLYTGTFDGPFTWPLALTNESSLVLEGSLTFMAGGLLVTPPSIDFFLDPGSEPFEAHLSIEVPLEMPPGIEPGLLTVVTPLGLGDQTIAFDVPVHAPVVVDMIRRAVSTYPDTPDTISAVIENLRPATPMDVDWSWWDEHGFLLEPLAGWRSMVPAGRETLHVCSIITEPVEADSVALTLHMLGDTGLPITTYGSIWLMVLSDDGTPVPDGGTPAVTRLLNNYPNPFNPMTRVRFHLAEAEPVRLVVLDLTGRRVATLLDEPMAAGIHERSWNGLSDAGRTVASGVYLVVLETKTGRWTQKAVLLR